MGIPYNKPVAAMRDTITIIRKLFAGEQLEYQGRVISARAGIRFSLEPERTTVPIYLGATGPKALELAGEMTDGMLPLFAATVPVRKAIESVRIGAARAGRSLVDFDFSAILLTSVGEDDRTAREATKPLLATWLGGFANQPDLTIFTEYGLTPADVGVIRERFSRGELSTEMVSEAMLDGLALAGSPERCREQLAGLIEAGLTSAVFYVTGSPQFEQDLKSLRRNLIEGFI